MRAPGGNGKPTLPPSLRRKPSHESPAITGLGQSSSVNSRGWIPSPRSSCPERIFANSRISAPAMKVRPSPINTTARTVSSAAASFTAAAIPSGHTRAQRIHRRILDGHHRHISRSRNSNQLTHRSLRIGKAKLSHASGAPPMSHPARFSFAALAPLRETNHMPSADASSSPPWPRHRASRPLDTLPWQFPRSGPRQPRPARNMAHTKNVAWRHPSRQRLVFAHRLGRPDLPQHIHQLQR